MGIFTNDESKKPTTTAPPVERNRIAAIDDSGYSLEDPPESKPAPKKRRKKVASSEIVETPETPPKPKPVVGEIVDAKSVNRRLAGLAKSIKTHQRKATEEILKCGAALAEAQSLLANHNGGSFGKWLDEKCDMTRRTAYRLLAVHKVVEESFAGCRDILARRCDADALRKLADGPASAILKAQTLMKDGERIDIKRAKQLVDAASPPKQSSDVHVEHIEVGGAMIVIRSKDKIDVERALMKALKTLRDAA